MNIKDISAVLSIYYSLAQKAEMPSLMSTIEGVGLSEFDLEMNSFTGFAPKNWKAISLYLLNVLATEAIVEANGKEHIQAFIDLIDFELSNK